MIVSFSRTPRQWLISTVISLIVFAVVYFVVIHKTNSTIDHAQQNAVQQVRAAGGDKAGDLAQCIIDAGTDISAAQACQAKFTH
jgi:large-conductance mechanosensitive channel